MAAKKLHLAARLNRARNAVAPVVLAEEKKDGEVPDAGEFSFARAREVRQVARDALVREKVLVVPGPSDSYVVGRQVVVNRRFTVLNSQDPDDAPIQGAGVGSASFDSGGASAAATIAEKVFLLSLLQIPTENGDREQARQEAARRDTKVTPAQITGFIGAAQREAKLSDAQVLDLAGVSDLRQLPQSDVESLVKRITEAGSE